MIIMLTAMAASRRLNTLDMALSPPWPMNFIMGSLARKTTQAMAILICKGHHYHP